MIRLSCSLFLCYSPHRASLACKHRLMKTGPWPHVVVNVWIQNLAKTASFVSKSAGFRPCRCQGMSACTPATSRLRFIDSGSLEFLCSVRYRIRWRSKQSRISVCLLGPSLREFAAEAIMDAVVLPMSLVVGKWGSETAKNAATILIREKPH